jgi:hypothetical protein
MCDDSKHVAGRFNNYTRTAGRRAFVSHRRVLTPKGLHPPPASTIILSPAFTPAGLPGF